MKTYLSLGAGVDTTAILLMPDIMDKTDFILFADTGGENPETYEYLDKYLKPYFENVSNRTSSFFIVLIIQSALGCPFNETSFWSVACVISLLFMCFTSSRNAWQITYSSLNEYTFLTFHT